MSIKLFYKDLKNLNISDLRLLGNYYNLPFTNKEDLLKSIASIHGYIFDNNKGTMNNETMIDLPSEIHMNIALNASPEDLINLCKTNSYWKDICDSTYFKKKYIKKNHWIEYYINYLKQKIETPDDLAVIKMLLNMGINPNFLSNEESLLLLAVVNNKPKLIKLLLQYNADPNVQIETEYISTYPIIEAAKNTEILKLLINAGVDINVQDHNGYTALINASALCNATGVELLLNAGANKNITTYGGETAIDLVCDDFYSSSDSDKIYDLLREGL